jgi:hypothetical protein
MATNKLFSQHWSTKQHQNKSNDMLLYSYNWLNQDYGLNRKLLILQDDYRLFLCNSVRATEVYNE